MLRLESKMKRGSVFNTNIPEKFQENHEYLKIVESQINSGPPIELKFYFQISISKLKMQGRNRLLLTLRETTDQKIY